MAKAKTPSAAKPSLWALLIGIDDYKAKDKVNPLRGCVNDVEAMRLFLVNHLRVPAAQIKVLTNAQATRRAILDAFQKFLIGNAKIPRGSQILFHYSGHGSQMLSRSAAEPDGLDETIVPHDSRTGGVFDIPDKTLAGLIAKLAAGKGDHLTVILDSCHSGSGTRATRPGTRRIPADLRPPPADLDAALRIEAPTRALSPSGWTASQATHVLLAGCRDSEESHEHQPAPGVFHGALTYFALEYLKQAPPGVSYADLHERVAAQVNALYRNQTPQCEGQRQRQVFGGAVVERDPFILVRAVQAGTVTLGAGLVHGLQAGTGLALYAASVKTRAELPAAPLATAEVTSASATSAQAKIIGKPKTAIAPLMRAVVTSQVYEGVRHSVVLQGDSAADRKRCAPLRKLIAGSPFLRLEPEPGDLRVCIESGQFSVRDKDGVLLVAPGDDRLQTLRALESISRYRALQHLTNKEAGSRIAGRVQLRLRKYVAGLAPKDMPLVERPAGGELTLYFDAAQPEASQYVAEIVNGSPVEVYPCLFYLDSEYAITRLYPDQGQEEKLRAGGSFFCCFPTGPGKLLDIYLPDEPRWESARDALKLVVTTQPGDLGVLEQAPLDVPRSTRGATRGMSAIDRLLKAVGSGAGTRQLRTNQAVTEDWGTAEFSYRVARAAQSTALGADRTMVELAPGITLRKPKRFKGEVTISTLEQTTRGLGDEDAVKPPPAFAAMPESFQPIRRAGTRSLGSAGLVLALKTDEVSRKSITEKNPLRLDLPGADDESAADVLPVAFDGEDYLIVGHRAADGTRAVDITRLPKPVATTRGTAKTIKLFFYKKMGRFTPQLGLRCAAVKDGKVTYSPVERARFKKGDTVAVLVHGFNSDTAWMVRDFSPWLRTAVHDYRHLLTFDYESFGTGVAENGEALAVALRQQCGCKAGDGVTVDVFAHSMGSLVSRCAIELSGGHAFVDRLVIAGPPNRGTTLGSSSRGFLYLLTALVNQLDGVPVLSSLNWLGGQLYESSVGWADLVVDSEITRNLNALEAPANVEYLVLAGENTPDANQLARLQRLAHKVLDRSLDTLFGEQNDKVVGRSSMHGLRGGTYPKARVEVVTCDHFGYFADAQCRAAIKAWMPAR